MSFIQELYNAKENGCTYVGLYKAGDYIEVFDDEPYLCGGDWCTYTESASYFIQLSHDELLELLKHFDTDEPIAIDDVIYHCNRLKDKPETLGRRPTGEGVYL